MVCYHGTSYENAMNILNGVKDISKNWNESESNCIYLWNVSEYRDYVRCMENAYNSGVICSAIQNSKEDYMIVFRFNIDEDKLIKDETCGFCNVDVRYWIKYNDMVDLIRNGECKTIEFPYLHERRERYLYNAYHSCGGMSFDSIKDNIKDLGDLIIKIERLEEWVKERNNNYLEYYFKETRFNREWIMKKDKN